MKKIILSIGLALSILTADAQVTVPPAGFNIKASITEQVGITKISIDYSRPGVKGREGKIWGQLVPYGFSTVNWVAGKNISPWRAGANEATVITFEHDVKVENKDIKAGSYALFMAMGQDSVVLIFSKQAGAWGSFYYRPEEDVLRIAVTPVQLERSVEWLKYEFIEHKEKSCVIALQWEKISIPFRVDVDVETIVVSSLRRELTGVKGFLSGNLMQASTYCFTKNINVPEAMAWAKRAVTGQPLATTAYDAYRNLAFGYERLTQLQQADSVMDIAVTIANANQTAGYSRTLLSQKRKERALQILLSAQKKFGDVYAINNSLAYAYSAKGDYSTALNYANKALEQAPSPQAKATITANIEKLKASKDIN